MNSEDAVNPLVGNIFSRLDEQDHRMDQFAMALQTLPSRTAHLESPTVAALSSVEIQALIDPGAAGLFIDAAFVSKHSILLQLRDTPFAIEALDGRPLQPA
ncbi:hypothetical protein AB205_0157910, partial [Aquarana catesbeiana]